MFSFPQDEERQFEFTPIMGYPPDGGKGGKSFQVSSFMFQVHAWRGGGAGIPASSGSRSYPTGRR
jgi:hypothetical protein